MKTVSKFLLGGAVISAFSPRAQWQKAPSTRAVRTQRVRTWFATGAIAPARGRGLCAPAHYAEMYADLVRDWNGPAKADVAAQEKRAVHTRTRNRRTTTWFATGRITLPLTSSPPSPRAEKVRCAGLRRYCFSLSLSPPQGEAEREW